MSNKKDQLLEMVLDFIAAQPGFNSSEVMELRVFCENYDIYTVLYGKDEVGGIMGFGKDIDAAYNDFVRSWSDLDGFGWIERNK